MENYRKNIRNSEKNKKEIKAHVSQNKDIRFQVRFSSDAMQELEAFVLKSGIKKAKVIRKALRLYMWLVDEVDSGYTLYLINKREKIKITPRQIR